MHADVPSPRIDAVELMRVLIADDSALLVHRLVAELSKVKGVEVIGQAASVGEAVQEVRILKPDVLILDIAMPGGCGLDVLESMKKDGCTSTVIVLTNYGFPQYRKKCFELGAHFFFDKSSEFEKVRGVLAGLMESPAPGGTDCGCHGGDEPSERVDFSTMPPDDATPVPGTLGPLGKPQLIVESKDNHQAVYYRCSHCRHEFFLAENQLPRVAATELIRGFRRHVQQAHPDGALDAVRDCQD